MHSQRRLSLRNHGLIVGVIVAVAVMALAPSAAAEPNANASERARSHSTSGTAGLSGDVGSPQPNSTADDNGVGANNGPGPYTSTRDGSPSGNGSGTGVAVGKPCAGCVGKADNKNPSGQMPGPSDGNAGYECDTNHGIAQTNPAHTGCTEVSGTTETPPCDTETTDCTPCVPSVSNNQCSEVLGEVLTPDQVLGETFTRAGTSLAATGVDAMQLVAMASVLLIAGGVSLAIGRRLAF